MEKIKLCYKFNLKTVSPLSIGGNYSDLTDHDVIRYFDNDETPFIPASSIAGCFFTKDEEYYDCFGIVDLGKRRNAKFMESSPLFISDGLFNKKPTLSTRDGNALESDGDLYKQTKDTAKFSSEIIQNNQEWSFFVVISLDSNSEYIPSYYDDVIKTIAGRIESGFYRIGYKQNRGYGKQTVLSVYRKIFDKSNYEEYLDFDGYSLNEGLIDLKEDKMDGFITLSMKVKSVTPICIKDYAAIKHVPDYSQIKGLGDNDEEVAAVPGTSLNGALQSAVIRIANELYIDGVQYNDDFKKFVIDEIYLPGNFLKQSRNKIDRFSGATIDSALYTEEIFTPTEESIGYLNIRFKHKNLKLIALFYLAFEDVAKGYVSIGGNEAIGRGVFENLDDIQITGTTKEELISALKEEL